MLRNILSIIENRVNKLIAKITHPSANAANIAALYVLIAALYNVAVESKILNHTMQMTTIYFGIVCLLIVITNDEN